MRILSLLFLCVMQAVTCTETILFNKEVNGTLSEVKWEVSNKGDKLYIVGISDSDTTTIECSDNFLFEQFYCHSKKDNEKLTFTKTSNTLDIISEKNGKKKTESYELKKYPWVQDFGFGLKPFLSSDKDSFLFYIINPKDLSMQTMIATKQGVETKTFLGKEYQAQKVKITLDGFYKRFWKAELWFDTKTRQLLFYKANEGPSTPTTILTYKGS